MAEVIIVDEESDYDNVTIKVDSFLKGKASQTTYTFTLVTREGMDDPDPSLKKGDTGVFFLKHGNQMGQVEKAYWGGVAVFKKNHFNLSKEKHSVPGPVGGGKKIAQAESKYGDWYFQCIDKECKIFTYVNIPKTEEDDPAVNCYVLALKSNKDIILQEVVDIDYHKTRSLINLPAEYIINNKKIVAQQFHDAKGKKIILRFDEYNEISSEPSLERNNYCVFKDQKAEQLIDLFRKRSEVVFVQKFLGLGFNYDIGEPYQKTKAVFSLIGFSKAYKRLFSRSTSNVKATGRQQ